MLSVNDTNTNLSIQSKGGILARAYELIMELRETPEKLAHSMDENAQLAEEVRNLRQVVNQLKEENSQLKAQFSNQDMIMLVKLCND